jgi:uncharacterized protein (TIGR02246 family)
MNRRSSLALVSDDTAVRSRSELETIMAKRTRQATSGFISSRTREIHTIAVVVTFGVLGLLPPLMSACAPAPPARLGPQREAALGDTLLVLAGEWTAAWNAMDPERMLRLHAGDGLFYWPFGRDTAAEFEETLHREIIPNVRYSLEMLEPHVRVLGPDAGIVSFHLRGGEIAVRSGETRPYASAVSLVFHRRGGEWKIVHIHEGFEQQPAAGEP